MERRVAFIVDDHVDTAEMLRFILVSNNSIRGHMRIFKAAYSDIIADHPCIALIDLHVSGKLTAIEFIHRMRRGFPDLPIVIVSADARAKILADTLENVSLFKPFAVDDVIDVVRAACSNKLRGW